MAAAEAMPSGSPHSAYLYVSDRGFRTKVTGHNKNEDRAVSSISKDRCALLRDQAPDEQSY